ncbi:MAG TPA: YwiC-like family protein [Chthonomonadaceae bacterium]|nr:YwiC-like family protein [Chthonomonadaceae bacterium]
MQDTTLASSSPRLRVGPPPVPREHGAWVILYAPLLIALATATTLSVAPVLLLGLAVTGLFLMRDTAGLLARRRGKLGTVFWLAVYAAVFAAGVVPLLFSAAAKALIPIGLVGIGLFAFHSLLLLWPARKRLDRSQWGEILGVASLALTAPAGYTVAHGRLDSTAWLLWLACTLFFSSAVFFVKMLLAAAKIRRELDFRARLQSGRDHLIYHTLLLCIVIAAAFEIGARPGLLLVVAFAPILARAFYGWVHLSHRLPPLKRAGILETVYSLWFAGFLLAALRIHP